MSIDVAVAEAVATVHPDAPRRRGRGLGMAAGALVVSFAVTFSDGSGWLRCALAIALVVLAPTAPTLTRRLVYNLATAMPLLVLTIWLPLGDAKVPLLLSGACATVVAVGARAGWHRVVPRSDVMEVSVLLVVGAVAWLVGSPFTSGDTASMLARLMRGWDHASHFDMYMAYRTGATLGARSSDAWYFAHYPQFFHALLAQTGELFWGPVRSIPTELARYSALQPVILTAVVLLTSALTLEVVPRSDPRRRLWAILFVCLLLFAFPGASLMLSGHLNFLLSAVAAAAVLVLANRRDVPFTAPHVVGMAALVVAVASWPLLLPCVAVPAVKVAVTGLRTERTRYLTIASTVAAGAASLYLVAVSVGGDPVAHLAAAGGLIHPTLASTVVVMAVMLAASHPRRSPRGGAAPSDLFLATVCSAVLLAAIAGVQLLQTGNLGYYFWKASIGVELVLLLSAASYAAKPWRALVRVLSSRLGVGKARPLVVGVFALASIVAFSQVPTGGLALYPVVGSPIPPEAREVGRLLLDVTRDDSLDATSTTFVSSTGGQFSPALVNQWYHSLTRTRTVQAGQFDALLERPWSDSTVALSDIVLQIAATADNQVVFGDPSLYRDTVADLPATKLRIMRLVPPPASLQR